MRVAIRRAMGRMYDVLATCKEPRILGQIASVPQFVVRVECEWSGAGRFFRILLYMQEPHRVSFQDAVAVGCGEVKLIHDRRRI